MKNSYKPIITLKETINKNDKIIKNILMKSKDEFASNESLINISLGVISELKEIISSIDPNAYILNPTLYEIMSPITNFFSNLFNSYIIPNAFKIYDFLKIDLQQLKSYLNN